MDTEDLHPLVDDLTGNIDDLEESLAPILKTALSHSTSKLPLLDKAKLYVLATYAIESVLFSYLRLNGVDAKSHPVFQELTRVKEYFSKIKGAEMAGQKRTTTLDKDAASRFIKHGLAGNEKHDREHSERIAKDKSGAKRKLEELEVGTHTRFDGTAKRIKAAEKEQNGTPTSAMHTSASNEDAIGTFKEAGSDAHLSKAEKKAAKQQRRLAKRLAKLEAAEDSTTTPDKSGEPAEVDAAEADTSEAVGEDSAPPERAGKKRKRKRRGQREEDERADEMK